MTHLVLISAPTTSMPLAALKQKGKVDPMPWKWSISADLVLLRRKSLHPLIALTILKQHSLVERRSGTFGAKPVLTTHLPRVRVHSYTLMMESSISPLRRHYDPEGIILPFQRWVGNQEPTSQNKLFSGAQLGLQHFEETCTPPAMLMAYPIAVSAATGLGTDVQLPLGQVKVKLWNS